MSLTKEVDELAVRYELKQQCQSAYAEGRFASNHNISLHDIREVCAGNRSPTASILKALGYERIVRYVKTSL